MTMTPAQIAALYALSSAAPMFDVAPMHDGRLHVATGDGRRWEMLPGGAMTRLDSVVVS
jgi:hypothetical protein